MVRHQRCAFYTSSLFSFSIVAFFLLYRAEMLLVDSHIVLVELTLVFEDVVLQGEELHSFILFPLQSIFLLFYKLYSIQLQQKNILPFQFLDKNK